MSQPAALANLNIRVFTQSGSKAEVATFPEHVRCSPNNRHSSRRAARLLCATFGHWGEPPYCDDGDVGRREFVPVLGRFL